MLASMYTLAIDLLIKSYAYRIGACMSYPIQKERHLDISLEYSQKAYRFGCGKRGPHKLISTHTLSSTLHVVSMRYGCAPIDVLVKQSKSYRKAE